MRIWRDHYEGTPYDLTKGLAPEPPCQRKRGSRRCSGKTILLGLLEKNIQMVPDSAAVISRIVKLIVAPRRLILRIVYAFQVKHRGFWKNLRMQALLSPSTYFGDSPCNIPPNDPRARGRLRGWTVREPGPLWYRASRVLCDLPFPQEPFLSYHHGSKGTAP